MYGDDLDAYKLKPQLGLLPQMVRVSEFEQTGFDFDDLIKFLQSLENCEKLLLSEVLVLVKLLVVIPTRNAVSECSFSAIKRVKTYLSTTTTDFSRLNNLMVLHVQKKETDNIDMFDAANRLVEDIWLVVIFWADLPWLLSPQKHYWIQQALRRWSG